jgi:hypothetical protein
LFKIINKKDIDLSWKNLIAPQEHINKFQNIVSKKVASEEKQQMKELQINFFIDNLKLMFFQDFLVLGKFFKHTLDQLSIKKLIKEMTDYYKKILDIAIKNSTNEKNLQTLNSIFLILNNFILINIDIDNEPQKTAYLTERFYCDLANLSNQEIYELNLYPEVIQIATAILMLEPKKTQPNFKKIDIVVDKLFRLFPQMKEDFPELIVEASTKIWVCGLNLWLKNKPQSLKLMNKYQLLEETYKLEISTDQQQVHKMLFCSYLEMLKKNYLSSKEVEFDNERNKIKIHCGNDVNLQKKIIDLIKIQLKVSPQKRAGFLSVSQDSIITLSKINKIAIEELANVLTKIDRLIKPKVLEDISDKIILNDQSKSCLTGNNQNIESSIDDLSLNHQLGTSTKKLTHHCSITGSFSYELKKISQKENIPVMESLVTRPAKPLVYKDEDPLHYYSLFSNSRGETGYKVAIRLSEFDKTGDKRSGEQFKKLFQEARLVSYRNRSGFKPYKDTPFRPYFVLKSKSIGDHLRLHPKQVIHDEQGCQVLIYGDWKKK